MERVSLPPAPHFAQIWPHLVPVNLAKLAQVLLAVGLLAKVVEQVRTPLSGGDARVGKRLDVALHVRQEDLETAHGALKVEQKVGALGWLSAHGTRTVGTHGVMLVESVRATSKLRLTHLLVWNLAVRLVGYFVSVLTGGNHYERSSCSL